MLAYKHSDSKPGADLKNLDVKNKTRTITATLSHPFIRNRAENLSGYTSFVYKGIETDMLGSKLSKDNLRVLKFGGTYDLVDRFGGISLFSAEFSQGLNILGSSETGDANLSRAGGRTDFSKITAEVFRLQRLSDHFTLLFGASGQYAWQDLLASEEFSVGGTNFGRGYDPSEISGVQGLASKVELSYGSNTDVSILKGFQLYGFYDIGAVWDSNGKARESLASAGVGTRFNLTNWVSGYLELAKPLTKTVDAKEAGDGNDFRLFFSLTARY